MTPAALTITKSGTASMDIGRAGVATLAITRGPVAAMAITKGGTGPVPPSIDFTSNKANGLTLSWAVTISGGDTPEWQVVHPDTTEETITSVSPSTTISGSGTTTVTLVNAVDIADNITRITFGGGQDILDFNWLPQNFINLDFWMLRNQTSATRFPNVSQWRWPNSLTEAHMKRNWDVEGDISNIGLPSGMKIFFWADADDMSANVTDWAIPATLTQLYLEDLQTTGVPDLSAAAALDDYRFNNQGLTQASVDAHLLAIYTNRAVFNSTLPHGVLEWVKCCAIGRVPVRRDALNGAGVRLRVRK